MSLGFSLYGMKDLSTEEAIGVVADIGFDSIELCLLPGWDAEPSRLDSRRRKRIQSLLQNTGLRLSSLMEHLSLTGPSKSQVYALDRLRSAAELGHQLNPKHPPLIETVAGKGIWNRVRNQVRDNLAGWAEIAKETRTVIAIKPHRGGVVDRPEYAVWLVDQVRSPWIKLNYDYSHFAHRDIPLAESIRTMLPHTCFIHVKDVVMVDGTPQFMLPGESGQQDYEALLKLVNEAGYQGDICCEVSSMLFKQLDYDPLLAAKTCYRNLSSAFNRARICRAV